MRAVRLARLDLTVSDLARAARFYIEALGFAAEPTRPVDPARVVLLGAARGEEMPLHRGGQWIRLQQFDPPGAAYPADSRACDLVFQHFALVTQDIAAAYDRLRPFAPTAISTCGPVALPPESGGATAFKFRDPDGHPLELIQFADRHGDGIDHTAIAVADANRSVAFYGERFGLQSRACQVNAGPAQDALDGVQGARVDVVALAPAQHTPHVELLGYRTPIGRPNPTLHPSAIAATRMVLEVEGLTQPALEQDPDGHFVLLEPVRGPPAPSGRRPG